MSARRYHHGNVREASLTATLAVLRDEGAEAITVRRIAREIGLSHTAVGKEFGRLSGLYAAAAARIYETLTQTMHDAAQDQPDAMHSLHAVAHAPLQFAIEQTHWVRLLNHPQILAADTDTLRAARRGPYTTLLDAVTRCVAEGDHFNEAPQDIALYLWSTVHGCASLIASQSMEDEISSRPQDIAENVLRQLYRYLTAQISNAT